MSSIIYVDKYKSREQKHGVGVEIKKTSGLNL